MNAATGHRWAARTAIAGTVFIALGAFWLSFTSLADLAGRSGIARSQAWAWPLIVDGIIVVATVSVVALAGQKTAWYPWMLLAGGALISVTANAVHAVVSADTDVPGALAAAVAAIPPIVLLAITHLTVILTRSPSTDPRQTRVGGAREVPEPGTMTVVNPAETPELGQELTGDKSSEGIGASERRERAVGMREAGWSNKRIARELGVHASTVGRWFAPVHHSDETSSTVEGDPS